MPRSCLYQLLNWCQVLDTLDGLSEFPVSFTVKLIGSDEHGSTLLGGVEQDAIGGKSVILVNLEDVTHFQVGGRLERPLPCGSDVPTKH